MGFVPSQVGFHRPFLTSSLYGHQVRFINHDVDPASQAKQTVVESGIKCKYLF